MLYLYRSEVSESYASNKKSERSESIDKLKPLLFSGLIILKVRKNKKFYLIFQFNEYYKRSTYLLRFFLTLKQFFTLNPV